MELIINTNNENSSDPTPKLKSSSVPILFIPFNENENKCSNCNNEYSRTLLFCQKYCKNCLFWHVKYTTGANTYLDVQCVEHEVTRNTGYFTKNIQNWCNHCSEISFFNQVVTYNL